MHRRRIAISLFDMKTSFQLMSSISQNTQIHLIYYGDWRLERTQPVMGGE